MTPPLLSDGLWTRYIPRPSCITNLAGMVLSSLKKATERSQQMDSHSQEAERTGVEAGSRGWRWRRLCTVAQEDGEAAVEVTGVEVNRVEAFAPQGGQQRLEGDP